MKTLREADRRVLEGLIERSCFSSEKLKVVERAAVAARDPQYALAFAAGLRQLEEERIPVEETVRQAAAYGRTVSLTWTADRWRVEHRKLQKAPILWRLASSPAASHAFSCEWLNAWVPLGRRRRVHIVNTPHRLGCLGFRLDYCFAGYEPLCRVGVSGVISVLLHGRRWAVVLDAPGEAGKTPTVRRVHGTAGAGPSESERTAIIELLQVCETPAADDPNGYAVDAGILISGIVSATAAGATIRGVLSFPAFSVPLFAVGGGMLAVRRISRALQWRSLANLILAVLWGVPAAMFPVACMSAGTYSAVRLGPVMMDHVALMPAGYLTAAVTWSAVRWLAAAVRRVFRRRASSKP